jgi:hypothetical protein
MAQTKYPVYLTGMRLTADLLSSGQTIYVLKASDTSRASTTTLADDPELSISLEADATYFVMVEIRATADAAGDIKTAWNASAGVSTAGGRCVEGPGSTQSETNHDNISSKWGQHGFTTSITYGARPSSNGFHFREHAVVDTTTGGTITVQWAQAASSVTATVVSARSLIYAMRID